MTLKEILEDPGISYWLKDAIQTAYERDPIDALHDARRLLRMLGERYTQIVNRSQLPGLARLYAGATEWRRSSAQGGA